ncbi:Translocating chain-associated membrane protein [Tyrophagus putrescentiae]|nr:Translocating chain-associated membrane protein [Tyrophagus putrescentiae]
MALKRRTGTSKNPPILSHEFVIQNHADIVSCVAMLIVIGLLFQATAPFCLAFVALQHNATEPLVTPLGTVISYTTGVKDLAIVFFYFLISIVIHAVVQEYVLDKITRKLHLSKTKHSKFNESGQLLTFILVSLVWAAEVIRREGYLFSITRIWSEYPARHMEMSYLLKFYFVIQIAYWLHQYPEVYFQKIKREEAGPRFIYASLYLIFFTAAYVLNFTRIAVVLSVLHYSAEALFHISRLLHFASKSKVVKYTFNTWNVLFPLVRLLTVSLSVTFFYFELPENATATSDSPGNYNTPLVRLTSMTGIGFLQAWMMWNFITFHLRRKRERDAEVARRKKNQALKLAAQKRQAVESDELNELPEADRSPLSTPSPVTKKSAKAASKLKVK